MTEYDDKQAARVDTVANAEPSKGRRWFVKSAIIAAPAVMAITRGRLAVARKGPTTQQVDANDPLHSNTTSAIASFTGTGG